MHLYDLRFYTAMKKHILFILLLSIFTSASLPAQSLRKAKKLLIGTWEYDSKATSEIDWNESQKMDLRNENSFYSLRIKFSRNGTSVATIVADDSETFVKNSNWELALVPFTEAEQSPDRIYEVQNMTYERGYNIILTFLAGEKRLEGVRILEISKTELILLGQTAPECYRKISK